MPADFSYQPLAQVNPLAIIPRQQAISVRGAIPTPEFNARQTLSDLGAIRQGMRQDKAAADAERLRAATVQSIGTGATQFDIADAEEYRNRFGSVPTDPLTGQIDMQLIRERLTAQKEIELGLKTQTALSALGGAGGAMNAEDRLKLQQDNQLLQESISKGEEALALISDPSKNVVGPVTGRKVTSAIYQVGAAFGIDVAEERFEDQRVLEMIVSENILKAAENMKGQLSDRDVKFLQAAVPKLSDTEDVWRRYFERWNKLSKRQMAQNEMFLNSGMAPQQSANQISDDEIVAELSSRGIGDDVIGSVLNATYEPNVAAPSVAGGGGQVYTVTNPDGTKSYGRMVNGTFTPLDLSGQAAAVPSFQNVTPQPAPAPVAPAPPPNPYANLQSVYNYQQPLLKLSRPPLQGAPVTPATGLNAPSPAGFRQR
jgi:hypothetical protein